MPDPYSSPLLHVTTTRYKSVAFEVDGMFIGELFEPPYSLDWDTAECGNRRARIDGFGNGHFEQSIQFVGHGHCFP